MAGTSKDVPEISKSFPSKMTFGFIGLGDMGSRIVKKLMSSGHTKMVIWNRSMEKCEPFQRFGATLALTPFDVVSKSDIIFSCVSNPEAVKKLVFGRDRMFSAITRRKSFVEMSGIDPELSHDINNSVTIHEGRYMEAVIQGSITEAESGNLLILAAGNKELFYDCQSVFCAIGKNICYLGDIGAATKMNFVVNMIKTASIAGLAEGMGLANKAGLPAELLLEILELTMKCPFLIEKGRAIMDNNFQKKITLKHVQKDLFLSLNMVEELQTLCPVTAAVNEVFKKAKRLGYGDYDISSIYLAANDIKKKL